MRIKVALKAEKLPILYRHRFVALIKDALNRSDPDYKKQLYPDKNSKHSEKVKPFAFSIFPPRFNYNSCPVEEFEITVSNPDKSTRPPKVRDKVIPIKPNDYLSMFVSSSDYGFVVNLFNGLLDMEKKKESFKFNDEIKLTFQRVFMLNEKKIASDEVVFKTLSPILLEEQIKETVEGKEKKKDMIILPRILVEDMRQKNVNMPDALIKDITDEMFNEHFSKIHNGILEDIRGENGKKGQGLFKPLEFIPVKLKRQVVKHTISSFWEKNPVNPVMKFTCFEGCFKLKGDPQDLQMFYQIGIGLRTGQGFGMVEVA